MAYLTIISITRSSVRPCYMVVNYGMPSHKLEDVRRLNTLQHGICKSYLEPTKTNNIRYVLTAPKSHSNYGRN